MYPLHKGGLSPPISYHPGFLSPRIRDLSPYLGRAVGSAQSRLITRVWALGGARGLIEIDVFLVAPLCKKC